MDYRELRLLREGDRKPVNMVFLRESSNSEMVPGMPVTAWEYDGTWWVYMCEHIVNKGGNASFRPLGMGALFYFSFL